MSLCRVLCRLGLAVALTLGGTAAAFARLAVPPLLAFDALPEGALSPSLLRSGLKPGDTREEEARLRQLQARCQWRSTLEARPDPLPHAYLGMNLAVEARREGNATRRGLMLKAAEFHLAAALGMDPWANDRFEESMDVSSLPARPELMPGRETREMARLSASEQEKIRDWSWGHLLTMRLALLSLEADDALREARFAELRRWFEEGVDALLIREDKRKAETGKDLPWNAPDAPKRSELRWRRMVWNAAWLGESDYLFRKLSEALPSEPWPLVWNSHNLDAGFQWLSCALAPEWKDARDGGGNNVAAPPEAAIERKRCLERARACFFRMPPDGADGEWAVFGALTADVVLAADAKRGGGDGSEYLREAARLAALISPYSTLSELLPVFLYDLALSGNRSALEADPWFLACRANGLIRVERALRGRASIASMRDKALEAETAAWTRALAPEGRSDRLGVPDEGGLWLVYLDWMRGIKSNLYSWMPPGGENGPLPPWERLAAARAACLGQDEPLGWWTWWKWNNTRAREDKGPDVWLKANAGLCPSFAAFAEAAEGTRTYNESTAPPREAKRAATARLGALYGRAVALPHPGLADMLVKGEWGIVLQKGEAGDISLEDWRRSLALCLEAHQNFTALRAASGERERDNRREAPLGEQLAVSVEERIVGLREKPSWGMGAENALKVLLRAPEEPLTDALLNLAREVYGYAQPDAPPRERDARLADILVEQSWYTWDTTRKTALLDRAVPIYAAALHAEKAGDASVNLRLGDALRRRVALMVGPDAGSGDARRRLDTALACYDAVLAEQAGSGQAHSGKALVLLEQAARGFRSGPDAGAEGNDGLDAALAQAREHYLLAAGLPPDGARADDAWSHILREVADTANGPQSSRLRAEADELAWRLVGGGQAVGQ